VADVEGLELRQGVLPDAAAALRAAVQLRIVEEDEAVIGGALHIDLHGPGAEGEGRLDRCEGVLQVGVFRGEHAGRGAGGPGEPLPVELLRHPPVGHQPGAGLQGVRQAGGVVEVDEGQGKNEGKEDPPPPSAVSDHAYSSAP
jgi:hypothetical protein